MSERITQKRSYKEFVLVATAKPLGSGGFNGSVLVTREVGDEHIETKLVDDPNVKGWIHDTSEKALEHGFTIGQAWVDRQSPET